MEKRGVHLLLVSQVGALFSQRDLDNADPEILELKSENVFPSDYISSLEMQAKIETDKMSAT